LKSSSSDLIDGSRVFNKTRSSSSLSCRHLFQNPRLTKNKTSERGRLFPRHGFWGKWSTKRRAYLQTWLKMRDTKTRIRHIIPEIRGGWINWMCQDLLVKRMEDEYDWSVSYLSSWWENTTIDWITLFLTLLPHAAFLFSWVLIILSRKVYCTRDTFKRGRKSLHHVSISVWLHKSSSWSKECNHINHGSSSPRIVFRDSHDGGKDAYFCFE
jgi:hypothetical protein